MASLDEEGQNVHSREYAVSLDAQDPLNHLRDEFLIPTKAQLKANSLGEAESRDSSPESSIYLCGNSLGLQPKLLQRRMQQYFTTWATQGVFGHFKPLAESPLPMWLDADAKAAESIGAIVGAGASEVAVMETLTANLHLLLSAFYKPDIKGRHKIIIESQAFPSDHFAAESQILHHDLDPASSLITISPPSPTSKVLTTAQILQTIRTHADDAAILLLPGIQYYTGQLLNIPAITEAAHTHGIFCIWDLAHAVGNVPLSLHAWNVDAAVWCSYKYLNAGPGAAGGLFVHEKHGRVSTAGDGSGKKEFKNRLAGWWGSDKSSRFTMDNRFVPIPGAAGFQLSNPSILDITSLTASIEVFALAGGLDPLREKSLKLTGYLESLLVSMEAHKRKLFEVITPKEKDQRGAQLSLKLEPGLLDVVMEQLVEHGVVVDERRPDVIRVAPVPLYNSFQDVWGYINAFEKAVDVAVKAREGKVEVEGTNKLERTS